jgi:hypothetical protein
MVARKFDGPRIEVDDLDIDVGIDLKGNGIEFLFHRGEAVYAWTVSADDARRIIDSVTRAVEEFERRARRKGGR